MASTKNRLYLGLDFSTQQVIILILILIFYVLCFFVILNFITMTNNYDDITLCVTPPLAQTSGCG